MTVDRSFVELAGKVAVVTGAAQGIGAATAAALAAFGADVAICDHEGDTLRATAATVEGLGRRVVSAELDVRDRAAVEAFTARVADDLGGIDVLVNNAGGGFMASFVDIRPKGVATLVDENFTSVVNFVQSCDAAMRDGGSIVNITSVEAFRAAPRFSIYAAMKAGIEQLSRTLALELADRRIRVNCIAPDGIPTPGDAANVAEIVGSIDEFAKTLPLGLGTADDCAAAVVFLASDLSRYVTGSTIHVDGGSLAASGWRRKPDGGWTV
jgi:3-oxoacyl-[acyl-carrier protein] reductase